jgi:hypothetical protein
VADGLSSPTDLMNRIRSAGQATHRNILRGVTSMKRGGRVRRTGLFKLHRGERVIPRRRSRRR